VERRTVSVTEAARILGISRAHAYDCVRSGELPAIVLGRRIVVSKAALDRILGESAGTDR
jgi:excisionase family DNA binding protein